MGGRLHLSVDVLSTAEPHTQEGTWRTCRAFYMI